MKTALLKKNLQWFLLKQVLERIWLLFITTSGHTVQGILKASTFGWGDVIATTVFSCAVKPIKQSPKIPSISIDTSFEPTIDNLPTLR